MIRTINIREETINTFQVVADISYAWQLIDNFTDLMQKGIQANPQVLVICPFLHLRILFIYSFNRW